jgi:N-acetylmuramoyl-L-alanine amidase
LDVLYRRARAAFLVGGLALLGLPTAALADGGLAGRTIVVDPGHGGIDGGASAYGRVEKNITLPIGLDLGALLRGQGAAVVYTRSSDTYVSLAARTAIANRVGASAFVAIHVNALNDPSYRGLMTFYGGPGGYATGVRRSPAQVAASQALATDVQAATLAQTGQVGDGVQPANYYVLGNAAMPAVLVETGFLTNPAEGAQLATPAMQERVASGIASGVARFFSGAAAVASTPALAAPALQSSSGGVQRYVVQQGDTLSALAVRFGLSEAELRMANSLPADGRILAGQTLTIQGHLAAGSDATQSPANGSAAVTATTSGTDYTIQLGDSLSAVALRFGVTEAALLRQNGLRNADALIAGRHLAIPGPAANEANAVPQAALARATPTRYRVRLGDTLSGVAARFGVTQQAVAQANALTNTNQVYAGSYLTIPAPAA